MKKTVALLLVLAMVFGLVGVASAAATEFKEAPMLAEKVANGELPKVEDRLPVAEDVFVATTPTVPTIPM